jgi:hypothetical protein
MSANIVGFVSRADAKLRKPNSVSRKFSPDLGGVATHYGGNELAAAELGADHSVCVDTWRAWQRYHMVKLRWVDIAYTGGFCNHGFAFAGRGIGVRTAANGTRNSNLKYYAVVWIGGGNQIPTKLALDALDWWIHELRVAGAGTAVRPHGVFKATGCPGKFLTQYSGERNETVINMPAQKPAEAPQKTSEALTQVQQLQTAAGVSPDGKWGPLTDIAIRTMRRAARNQGFEIRKIQRVLGVEVDGFWGPVTQAALKAWVVQVQLIIGVKPDGKWGPLTDAQFLTVRRGHFKNY